MSRLGLKISCFVVSVIIWVQVASTSVVEQTINLPLAVASLGPSLTIAGSDLPHEVKVRLRGSKLRLLAHTYFSRFAGEVIINGADWSPGPTFVYEPVGGDVVSDLIFVGFPHRVRLRIQVDHEWTRLLPVGLASRGKLPGDVDFLVPPVVDVDSVLVSGPSRFFPASGVVTTETVDLGQQTESGEFEVPLVSSHAQLKLDPATVRVLLQLAPVLERTLANIPVIPLVDVDQLEVGVSPPVVDVMVRGVADSIQTLEGHRITVTVAVGGLERGVHMVAGEVSLPRWLSLIRLEPAEFRVVVGHLEPVQADSLRLGLENPHE